MATQVVLGRPLVGDLEAGLGAWGTAEGRGLSSPRLLGGMAVAALLGSLSWAESRKRPRIGGESSGAGRWAQRGPGPCQGGSLHDQGGEGPASPAEGRPGRQLGAGRRRRKAIGSLENLKAGRPTSLTDRDGAGKGGFP